MNLIMKQLGGDTEGTPEEKTQARLDLFEDLRYFVEDPKEFLEVPKQEPGIMIHYPSLNEEGWTRVKKYVRSMVFARLGKRFRMDIYDDGTIFFPNIASNNFTMEEFRKRLKEALDYFTRDMRGLGAMSEKAKELGAKVLEMPEMRKEIAKFLPTNRGEFEKRNEKADLEYLLSEREERATEAQRLQLARQRAMKNEGLEKLMGHIIEQDTYYLMFWDENPMFKVTNGMIDLEIGQNSIVEEDEYQDPADYLWSYKDLDEANKVMEDSKFGSKVVTVSRRFLEAFYDDLYDRYVEYKEEEPGTYKPVNQYDLTFVGLDDPLKGDDRKFMLIYLKKKFKITEADIEAKIKENAPRIEEKMKKFEAIMAERRAKKAEKEERKKARAKEREATQETKATEKGVPKGKANAIVLTWREIKEKFPQIKKTEKYDDDKKFKVWLARTNYHLEPV